MQKTVKFIHDSYPGNPVKYAQVNFEVGEGWSTDPRTNFANQYTVTITVPTYVSNPNASINVNGDLSDWAALTSFAVDPKDATASGDVADWAQAALAHDANNLYLALQNHVSITQLNAAFSVYLDTDNTRSTGFRGGNNEFPVGAEFVLLGTSLYHYKGTGLDWQWTLVGTAGFMFFQGDNPSLGGTTVDSYPDAALQPQGGALVPLPVAVGLP